MSSHDNGEPADLARRCWDELNTQRIKQRVSMAKLGRQVGEPESTLYFWLNERKSLPERENFLAIVKALGLDETQWAARWNDFDQARTYQPRPKQGPEDPPPSSSMINKAEKTQRSRVAIRKILSCRKYTAILATITLASVIVPLTLLAMPSMSPSRTIYAADYRAHADFYRAGNTFHLFDDDPDGHSAVLQYSVNNDPLVTAWNKQGAGKNKKMRVVDLPIPEGAEIKHRVCTGEYGQKLVIEKSCSQWVNETSGPDK
jgi:hypothetical protein